MTDEEYRHVENVRNSIERDFTIETGGGLFTIRPGAKLRKDLGLADDASWVFSTLENAGSWVAGFREGVTVARIARRLRRTRVVRS